jgi:hypothetical protein
MNRLLRLDSGLGRKADRRRHISRAYDTNAPIVLRYDDFHKGSPTTPTQPGAHALSWESLAIAEEPPTSRLVMRELICADGTQPRGRLGSVEAGRHVVDEAFASDLQDIVAEPASPRGPEPPRAQPAPPRAPRSASPAPPAPPARIQSDSLPLADRHAIFDRLAHANTFDAGTLSVDWHTLDRALDAEERAAARAAEREERAAAEAQALGAAELDAIELASDLAAITDGVSGPVAAASMIDLRYKVDLVAPTEGLSPSAAAAAMLIAWRDGIPPNLPDITSGRGYWERHREALRAEDPLTAVGLVAELPRRYRVEELKEILDRWGPLIVGADGARLVVTGIYGDGTPQRTFVEINTPAGPRTERFAEFAAADLTIAHLATSRTITP